MKKEAQLKLSFGEMDRLLKRQEFSTAYIALNQKVRGFAPSYFQAFKFAFYNVKSDEALLDKKGIEVKRKTPEAKKPSYNQYLDYAEGIELDYLIRGLNTVRKLVIEMNGRVASPNFFTSELLKQTIKMRKQFLKETGMFPEDFPRAERSIGALKATKEKIKEQAYKEKFGELKQNKKAKKVKDAQIKNDKTK